MRARVIFVLWKRTLLEKAKDFPLEASAPAILLWQLRRVRKQPFVSTYCEGVRRVVINFEKNLETFYAHPPVCDGELIVFRTGASYSAGVKAKWCSFVALAVFKEFSQYI